MDRALAMSMDHKNSCTTQFGAEILMVVTSFIIAFCAVILVPAPLEWMAKAKATVEPGASLLISLGYALFLPLMSYLFSQAKHLQEGRAQLILIWMVFIEIIRIRSDPKFSWGLRKSAEQFVRLFWVSFLIYSYTSLNGIRASLFVLCVYFAFSEVLKGYCFNKGKNSMLIGKNPELIHNYVKKKMLANNDLQTTPMDKCDYIVMGEEHHKLEIDHNGYRLGEQKPNSVGLITVGRVFQLNSSEDEAFTSTHPYWRETCLSFALAKMLMRRFAKLPTDEAESRKALDFVLEWLNNYVDNMKDIQMEGSNRKRNPCERVFDVIEDELKFVSEFFHTRKPIYLYFPFYMVVDMGSVTFLVGTGIYLIYTSSKRSSAWMSQLVAQDAHNHCFFNTIRDGSVVMEIFSRLDLAITILLFIACIYIQYNDSVMSNSKWFDLDLIKEYIRNSTEWYERHLVKNRSKKQPSNSSKGEQVESILESEFLKNVWRARVHTSVLELKAKTFIGRLLPKWIRRKLARATPTGFWFSTDAKQTILKCLRKSLNRFANGDTSLKVPHMEQVNWTSNSNWSNTEAILVWHIATTLLHYQETPPQQNSDSHQEPSTQQNKERQVALELSSYCHKLAVSRPELLPDAVEWTEKMYEDLRNEIFKIDQSPGHKPTKNCRCNYALKEKMDEYPIIGKGAKLAKDMASCAENRANMWPKIADFWAEMLLFVAPSDNMEGHEEMLERGELITQLWALLTHAGIHARPKMTEHQYRENNEDNGIATSV